MIITALDNNFSYIIDTKTFIMAKQAQKEKGSFKKKSKLQMTEYQREREKEKTKTKKHGVSRL